MSNEIKWYFRYLYAWNVSKGKTGLLSSCFSCEGNIYYAQNKKRETGKGIQIAIHCASVNWEQVMATK